MSEKKSRFERFKDKFFHPPEVPKKTLGTVLSEEVQKACAKRINEVLPHFASAGSCNIRTNAASFWESPTKVITITCLVEFYPDMVWRDEQGEDAVASWEKAKPKDEAEVKGVWGGKWEKGYQETTDKQPEEKENEHTEPTADNEVPPDKV